MKVFMFFMAVLCYSSAFCQDTLSIALKPAKWDVDRKSFSIRRVKSDKTINTDYSSTVLRNGDTLYPGKRFTLTVQRKSDSTKGVPLQVIVGTTNKAQLAFIIDKNNRNGFSDDSVYLVNYESPVVSLKQLYSRLPLIKLDSVEVEGDRGKEFKKIELKLGISKLTEGVFESLDGIRNAADYYLDVYTTNYYASTLQKDGKTYEIGVVLNPLIYGLPAYPGTSPTDGAVFVYEKKAAKDSTLNMIPIGMWSASGPLINNLLKIGSDTFHIAALSLKERKIFLQKGAIALDHKIELSKGGNAKRMTEILKDNAITLLDFSGSWCKPCQEILPGLKSLYNAYGNKLKFVTVDVERSVEEVSLFKKTTAIAWEILAEDLACSDSGCLQKVFSVNGYPTLLLIDGRRNILFKEEGTGAVKMLEAYLKAL